MNVLSLFGGIETGLIALKELGVKIDNYYSSEINKYASSVARFNHPEIIELGDVSDYKNWDLPKIDLVLAGPPCQGFSIAGKRLNWKDPRSQLFFTAIEILWKYDPKYFLFENVASMKKEIVKEIDELMEVDSIIINSALVSAQNRKRNYWCNWEAEQPEDKGILACNYHGQKIDTSRQLNRDFKLKISSGTLDLRGFYAGNSNSQRVYGLKSKLPTLLTNNTGGNNPLWITEDNKTAYRASIDLCEWLQTLPSNYTNGVNIDQRYKMIGNGWTKDVIKHILKGILMSLRKGVL